MVKTKTLDKSESYSPQSGDIFEWDNRVYFCVKSTLQNGINTGWKWCSVFKIKDEDKSSKMPEGIRRFNIRDSWAHKLVLISRPGPPSLNPPEIILKNK